MSKIKAFFYVIYKSLTNLDYYKHLLEVNVSFSIKYYAVLVAILALASSGAFAVKNSADIRSGVSRILNNVANIFPDDLVVTAKDGSLSVNKPEPYIIETPKDVKSDNFPKNLIIFDSNGTITDVTEKDTLVLVNSKNILVENSHKIEVYPTADIVDGSLNKAKFSNFINQFKVLAKYLPAVAALAVFIGMLFYYFGFRMIYALIVGLMLLTIGRVKGQNLPYSKYFQFGLHSMSTPLLIEFLFNTLEIGLVIPMWFFIVHIIIGVFVLNGIGSSNSAEA